MLPQVSAAVGVMFNADGGVLLQRRGAEQIYPNYWEFPGGKIECGESPEEALKRELSEEIGVTDVSATPWLVRRHAYQHAALTLHFFRVTKWRGAVEGLEGQDWRWWSPHRPPPPDLLPANAPLWKWLTLPPVCAITAAEVTGVEELLQLAPRCLAAPGGALVQLRDKNLPPRDRRFLAVQLRWLTRQAGALLLVNDDETLAAEVGADGVHLSSRQLNTCRARPPFLWVGASCHNAEELQRAAALGLDFAVLSPVCKTLTHVDGQPLGWDGFAALAERAGFPLYALGGMRRADLPEAQRRGAQGIGMMRRAWTDGDGRTASGGRTAAGGDG